MNILEKKISGLREKHTPKNSHRYQTCWFVKGISFSNMAIFAIQRLSYSKRSGSRIGFPGVTGAGWLSSETPCFVFFLALFFAFKKGQTWIFSHNLKILSGNKWWHFWKIHSVVVGKGVKKKLQEPFLDLQELHKFSKKFFRRWSKKHPRAFRTQSGNGGKWQGILQGNGELASFFFPMQSLVLWFAYGIGLVNSF